MNFGYLRPVGEYLPISAGSSTAFRWPEGYSIAWCDSGTTALGLALRVASEITQRPSPTALMPAYTCPDVVSAALWADVKPVIVDTQADKPWLAEDALLARMDKSVAAIVAPHFLGIRHPLGYVSQLCRDAGALLIEDSAQLGPTSPVFKPEGDLVVLSFGRGKPVPAGGGALLYREQFADIVSPLVDALPERRLSASGWKLRAALQNVVMTRAGFAVVRRMPWMHVGETRFKELTAPQRLGPAATARVEGVLAQWAPEQRKIARALRAMLQRLGLPDTATDLGWDGESPLLRYPVLMRDRAARDEICDMLHGRNIGATAFYGTVLTELPGVPAMGMTIELPRARDFATRLLTLPCHSAVKTSDLDRIEAMLATKGGGE